MRAQRTPGPAPEAAVAKRNTRPARALAQAPAESHSAARADRAGVERACRRRHARSRRARSASARDLKAARSCDRRAPWHPLPLSELLILVGVIGAHDRPCAKQGLRTAPRCSCGDRRGA